MQDLACRATDPEIYDISEQHNAQLFCHPDLHAKAYIADGNALIGSANATVPGLGMASNSNLELLVPSEASSPWIKSLLGVLESKARTVNPVSSAQLEEIGKYWSKRDMRSISCWVPNANYEETVAFIQHGSPNQLAANDCFALDLLAGADEKEIKAAAKKTEVFKKVISHLELLKTEIDKKAMSKWLVSFSGDPKFRNSDLSLPFFDWLDKCTDYYILDLDKEVVKLTPWKKWPKKVI